MAPTEHPYHAAGDGADVDALKNEDAPQPPVMVHVVAPAALPGGYTFEAQLGPSDPYVDEPALGTSGPSPKSLTDDGGGDSINKSVDDGGRTFTVTVPEGGVAEGETFLAPLPRDMTDGMKRIRAPTGRWKDGLFACGRYGWFHPALCCALCCTQIAMGQVMQRLRLTWLGHPGSTNLSSVRNTFAIVVTVVISYTVYSTALEISALPPRGWDPIEDEPYYIPPVVTWMKFVGSVLFTIWSIYALCRTRRSLRATYSIPEERCEGCEDLCCSAFCSCCAVAQMLRHTGEYETYRGACLTGTGLPRGSPAVV